MKFFGNRKKEAAKEVVAKEPTQEPQPQAVESPNTKKKRGRPKAGKPATPKAKRKKAVAKATPKKAVAKPFDPIASVQAMRNLDEEIKNAIIVPVKENGALFNGWNERQARLPAALRTDLKQEFNHLLIRISDNQDVISFIKNNPQEWRLSLRKILNMMSCGISAKAGQLKEEFWFYAYKDQMTTFPSVDGLVKLMFHLYGIKKIEQQALTREAEDTMELYVGERPQKVLDKPATTQNPWVSAVAWGYWINESGEKEWVHCHYSQSDVAKARSTPLRSSQPKMWLEKQAVSKLAQKIMRSRAPIEGFEDSTDSFKDAVYVDPDQGADDFYKTVKKDKGKPKEIVEQKFATYKLHQYKDNIRKIIKDAQAIELEIDTESVLSTLQKNAKEEKGLPIADESIQQLGPVVAEIMKEMAEGETADAEPPADTNEPAKEPEVVPAEDVPDNVEQETPADEADPKQEEAKDDANADDTSK